MASVAREQCAWTRPNTENCTLILLIDSEGVSLSVLQPSGRVLNLLMERGKVTPSPGQQQVPYTIPLLVVDHPPKEFLCGKAAQLRSFMQQETKLWDLAKVLWGMDGTPSTLKEEFLLAMFLRYVIDLVEHRQWDDLQGTENLFKLNDHVIFLVPLWMPCHVRQRISDAARILKKKATLVNAGTLVASVCFELHHLSSPRVQAKDDTMTKKRLLVLVEQLGNVDLHFYLEKGDHLEMIGFTGNMHLFPDKFQHDELLELQSELVVLGQGFKRAYNASPRNRSQDKRQLIWGLLRDMKLRVPRHYRSMYQKQMPVVGVGECPGQWKPVFMEECSNYFTANNALPERKVNGEAPQPLLWNTKVNFNDIFNRLTLHVEESGWTLEELKAYKLIAVVEKKGTGDLETVVLTRLANGVMMLTLTHGTTTVMIMERICMTGESFPIGTLTVNEDVYSHYSHLVLEVKLNPSQGTYSWQGLWEADARGNQWRALDPNDDYQWKGTELSMQDVDFMGKEITSLFEENDLLAKKKLRSLIGENPDMFESQNKRLIDRLSKFLDRHDDVFDNIEKSPLIEVQDAIVAFEEILAEFSTK